MPAASFIINDSDQCLTNNTFGFTNTSKIAWGGLNARWEFGDGGINTGTNTTHSYAAIGSYTLLLQETSINNCIDTTRKICWCIQCLKRFSELMIPFSV